MNVIRVNRYYNTNTLYTEVIYAIVHKSERKDVMGINYLETDEIKKTYYLGDYKVTKYNNMLWDNYREDLRVSSPGSHVFNIDALNKEKRFLKQAIILIFEGS